ncbi:MAG TPA: DM13 domain-containing protein [Ilumatobacteraceae bacterium]|nr:DM13 domain-containing protein [Ilumatobacteraceae bacterium]
MTEFISNAHSTSGKVLVVALADGSVVMRFEDLESDNGPDLRVVLSTSTLNSGGDYGGRLILEHLKGNIGSQNYTIGTDVDLGVYRSVVIWCERFGVAFGSAAIDVTA